MKFSKLNKIVKILAIHNEVRKLIKPNPPSLTNIVAVMLLKPKFLDSVRKFKPTESELHQAFMTLVRTSQSLYPPSSKYFKPVVSNNIVIASLIFDANQARESQSVCFLPLISCQDVDIVRPPFHEAHILEAGPFDLHRSGTLAQGNYVSIIPYATKVLPPY